jgi:1-acyl-sn-glycerol-3-phosphate acyltransferase
MPDSYQDDPFGEILEPSSGASDLTGEFVELSSEITGLPADAAALTVKQVQAMGVDGLREHVPAWLAQHVVDQQDLRAEVQNRIEASLADMPQALLERTLEALHTAGDEFRFYPHDAAARLLGREFIRSVLPHANAFGVDALPRALDDGPTLVVCNQLSYADAQFTDLLLSDYEDSDEEELSCRLAFVVLPRAYDNPYRRMAAISLDTIAFPSPDTALAASMAGALQETHDRMARGHAVVLYAEGARSKSGRLGSFRRAASAFAATPGARIVPMAITGTDEAFPVHKHQLGPAAVTLSVGEAIEVEPLGPEEAMEAAWREVAELLPDGYQPAADTSPLV